MLWRGNCMHLATGQQQRHSPFTRKYSALRIDREPLPPCRASSRTIPCGAGPAESLAWRPLPVNPRRNFLLIFILFRAQSM